MNKSKNFLEKHGISTRVSFKENPCHTFELVSDELKNIPGDDGEMVEGMLYTVIEDGTEKEWFTTSISAIRKIAELNEGDIVSVELKKKKKGSKWINYYDVFEADSPKDKSGVKGESPEEVNEILQGIS